MNKRLASVEGLRGLAAIIVLFHHFFLMFYPGYYWQQEYSHLPNGWDHFLGQTPFAFFLNGNSAVTIFLVITGFGTMLACHNKSFNVSKFLITRFFKLFLMSVAAAGAVWGLSRTGLLLQNEVIAVSNTPWFLDFMPNAFSFKYSLWHDPLVSLKNFDNMLWTMEYFFYGAVLSFIYHVCWNERPTFIANIFIGTIFGVLVFLEGDPYYIACVLGCFLGALYISNDSGLPCAFPCFLFGIWLCAYPTCIQEAYTLYAKLPNQYFPYYHSLGSALLLYGVLYSNSIRQIFSCKFLTSLGKYSMAIYLVQYPLLVSVVSKAFILTEGMRYYQRVCIALAACLVSSGVASWVYHHLLNRCFRILDSFYLRIIK